MDPQVTVKENGDFRRIYRKGRSAVSGGVVVYCLKNRKGMSEADALTGLLLRSDPLYGEYLSQHLIKLNRARDGLAVSSLADKEARIAHLENLIEEIERRKGEWEHGNGT